MKFKKTVKIKSMVDTHHALHAGSIVWCSTRKMYLKRNEAKELIYSWDGRYWVYLVNQLDSQHCYYYTKPLLEDNSAKVKRLIKKRDKNKAKINDLIKKRDVYREQEEAYQLSVEAINRTIFELGGEF